MTDLVLKRRFQADIETVFQFVSAPDKVILWWGPEGVTVHNAALSFTSVGAWTSEMHGPDGTIYKVSGVVTKVDPPKSVSFTWAWHDDNDVRGHESLVTISLAGTSEGTEFTLTHTGLADDESAKRHNEGWTSSIGRLEKTVSEQI